MWVVGGEKARKCVVCCMLQAEATSGDCVTHRGIHCTANLPLSLRKRVPFNLPRDLALRGTIPPGAVVLAETVFPPLSVPPPHCLPGKFGGWCSAVTGLCTVAPWRAAGVVHRSGARCGVRRLVVGCRVAPCVAVGAGCVWCGAQVHKPTWRCACVLPHVRGARCAGCCTLVHALTAFPGTLPSACPPVRPAFPCALCPCPRGVA